MKDSEQSSRFREVVMSAAMLRGLVATLIYTSLTAMSPLAAEPIALRSYNAPIGESSISGVSSGAYMAVQFGTAWSSIMKGVGVIAGGPYWCAKADAYDFITWYWGPVWRATDSCMKGPASDLNVSGFMKADAKAAAGDIDPLRNLGRQKIYLFHGYNDALVARAATDPAADFYRHYLGNANRGNNQTTLGAGHSFVVTEESGAGEVNSCGDNKHPFIGQCGYDQAGIILQHIYGRLKPPNRGQVAGSVKSFSQAIYTKPQKPGALSLGDTGYVFVPQDCERGGRCRVHVALHGCKQDVSGIGRRFVEDTGYNAWADTNQLIVIYPQTKPSPSSNPFACWDWWSYIDHEDSYITKSGSQVKAIKAMLDALTDGATTAVDTAVQSGIAPEGLTAIDRSDTSVDLVCYPVVGATNYRVSRAATDGIFHKVGDVIGASFADSGLRPQSNYRWLSRRS